MSEKKHIAYLDYLRLLACLAVVFLHVSVQKWAGVDIQSTTWRIYNAYSCLVRWAVPVFVMVSGSLFLNLDRPFSVLLKKNVLRLVILFFIWSFFYAAIYALQDVIFNTASVNPKAVLKNFLSGHYHMWFIPMFIGLYLWTPFYSKLVKDPKLVKPLFILVLIFAFIVPFAVNLLDDFGFGFFAIFGDALSYQTSSIRVCDINAYSGYFILGYILGQHPPTKKQRRVIYLLGAIGVLLTVFLSMAYAHKYHVASARYFKAHTLNVTLQAVAVYVFIQAQVTKPGRLPIRQLSQYALGVILLHPFILSVLDILGFDTAFTHPILSVPVVWLAVSGISLGIVWVLHKIPFIRKYML